MSGFSAAVKLGDLDDYLTPANDCIIPLTSSKAGIMKPVTNTDVADTSAVIAGVTLSDCLACSGCVTSAETILLESQSVDELLNRVSASPNLKVVFSLSSASRRALAAHYKIPPTDLSEWLFAQLCPLLGNSLKGVLDLSLAEAIVLNESVREQAKSDSLVLTSHCPGWTCYASKLLGEDVLKHLSRVKSAEQIQGLILKRVLPTCSQFSPSPKIMHVLIAPCFDKKLEIIRPGYDAMVDLALSSTECIDMIRRASLVLGTNPSRVSDPIYSLLGLRDVWVPPTVDASAILSGGYAQVAAGPSAEWSLSGGKSDLFQSDRYMRSNGFRNIQNVTRRVKSGQLNTFRVIEVMACPGGCPFGGGQPSQIAPVEEASYWQRILAFFHSTDQTGANLVKPIITCNPDEYEPAVRMRKLIDQICPLDIFTEWKSLAPIDEETGEKKTLASDLKW